MEKSHLQIPEPVAAVQSHCQPVFVVGADGMLGGRLLAMFERNGRNVWGSTRKPAAASGRRVLLDLAESTERSHLPFTGHGAAILCAACTSMALCEREPERTREVNVDHTVTLAQRLVDAGVFVVFLSSNTVFDGSTPFANSSQLPNPQCEYGRQKAAAEAEILNFGDKAAVIRFTKIFDPNTRLMRGWVSSLRYDAPIQPFSDAMIAPVSIAFAATVISAVVEHQSGGIHQVSASHDISYVHAATYLATQLGANPKLIRAVSSKDTGGPIFPKHTTLDTITLSQLGFDAPPPTWALDQFL